MKFWKIFFGIIGGGILFILLIIGVVAGVFAILDKPTKGGTTGNTVLCINFAEDIIDAPLVDPLSASFVNINAFEPITIYEALAAIERAESDSSIKGIYIRPDGLGTVSAATLEELRAALIKFKESGKFIIAYDDAYTQSEYYFASVADQVYLNPEGSIDWRGVSLSTLFLTGLLEKLDVDVEIFRPTVCRYKSAVEPYFLKKMSPENRKQMEMIANSTWNTICEDVNKSRGISVDLLKSFAKNQSIALSEDALNAGFVDKLIYEDELLDILDSYGIKRNEQGHPKVVSLGTYAARHTNTKRVSTVDSEGLDFEDSPLVAVLYANGEIVDGDMYADDYIYGTTLARQIRQLRLDDRTKAVVIRVNSPGGSALASEVVWREMVLLQKEKPIVVSMGEMAASGGYYISVPADLIVANRLTLTGSIGVFGMFFNIGDMLENKLGITIDSADTSPSASASLFAPLSAENKRALNTSVDNIYEVFTEHVAEGRNLSIEAVYNVAEGRVWSGSDALECGLVDKIGGLTEAIAEAVNLADIGGDFAVYEFVAPPTAFEQWLNSMGFLFASQSGLSYDIYGDDIRSMIEKYPFLFLNTGVQTLCPGDVKIEL